MNWVNAVTIYLISMMVVAIYWSAHIRTLSGANYARMCLPLCAAMCFYILGYAMELNASNPGQTVFWNRVQYLGIPYVSALWLTIALMYTGRFARHQKAWAVALYGIPVLSMALRLTNDHHHLYFAATFVEEAHGRLVYVKQGGPWMRVQAVHSMTMVFAAMALWVINSVRSTETHKGKIVLTILASVFAATGLLLWQVKLFGHAVDSMALCLPITSVLVIFAIARYDLLDIQTLGRRRVFECSEDAVLLLNPQQKIIDYNHSAKRLFEKMNVPLAGGHASLLLAGVPDWLEALRKAEPSIVKLCVEGETRYYEILTLNVDRRSAAGGRIKTIRDVTQVHRLTEELKRQAMTDELSVLNNRRAFLNLGREWVDKANESGASLHLSILDLDHFKVVNDRYGHAAGDLVIRNIGRMLQSHFPEGSLIARLGGEEFAVLQAGLTNAEMLRCVKAFLADAGQYEYSDGGHRFHVTASIGITRRKPGQALEDMMRSADQALYRSKNGGRNRVTVAE